MEYSNNDFRNYELYHHGILGQKWGRQQGPPYPLDASDHSASEKKAGWRKSLDGGSNSGGSGSGKSHGKTNNRANAKAEYKQKKKRLDQELEDRKKKIQEEYDTEIAKIEGKYKNGNSKISDEDFKKERELEEKYNKDWDEANRKYNQGVRDLKKESGKGNRFTRAIGDAVREVAEEYAHDNSLEAEYERKKAEQDMQNNKIVKNAQRTKNAKGMSAKLDEMIGAGALKTDYEEEAKYHDRMARTYKNESLRREHEIAAQNARIKAEYEAKRSEQYQKGGMKAAKQAGHDFLYGEQDYMNMKYIDATGKETTRGKEALRSAIFSTVFDIAIDAVIGPTSSSSDSSNNTSYAWKFTEHYNDAKNYYRNQ